MNVFPKAVRANQKAIVFPHHGRTGEYGRKILIESKQMGQAAARPIRADLWISDIAGLIARVSVTVIGRDLV